MKDAVLSLQNQGLCRIRELATAFPPALCEIRTDLLERYPVFDPNVVMVAERCQEDQIPVSLVIRRSQRNHDYVAAVIPIDFREAVQPCLGCGHPADRVDVGDGAPYFSCASCHRRMFLSPKPWLKASV